MDSEQKPEEKQTPETLDQLEEQLDKNQGELSKEVVNAENESPGDNPPPDPRAAGVKIAVKVPGDDNSISDDLLKQAGSAADEVDDTTEESPTKMPAKDTVAIDSTTPKPHFWKRKKFWFITVGLLVLILIIAWLVTPSRLFIVNALGLRATLTINTATLPEAGQKSALLKNVDIKAGDATGRTNDQGTLQIKTKYGSDVAVAATKPGYDGTQTTITVDFDPFFYLLGGRQQDQSAHVINLQLKSVGIPLKFTAKDLLSGKPITIGSFNVGDVVAQPDGQGVVSLTVPATDAKTISVKAAFGGTYQDKTFDVPLDGSQPTVNFAPAGKDYFVSSRGGGLAIYASDIDGNNAALVVPASANETSAVNFVASPSGKYGVLISTRGGVKDAQGNLLQQLFVVDLSTNKLNAVDQAKWFNFVDWSGDTLIYVAGEQKPGSATVTQRLASVNAANSKQTSLSSANSYGAVRVALNSVVYQVNYVSGDASYANTPELKTVPITGGTEKSLGYKVGQIAQTDAQTFAYQTSDGAWHQYNVNTAQNQNASAPSSTYRVFLASATSDGQTNVVIDQNDGVTAIIAKNVGSGQETKLYSDSKIAGPIRIVSNAVIFRMGSADYALSLNGGSPKKISDVTSTPSPITVSANYFELL